MLSVSQENHKLRDPPIQSLPPEILYCILCLCSFQDIERIKVTSRSFYQAYLLEPSISARQLLKRVFHGEFDLPRKNFVTDCPPLQKHLVTVRQTDAFEQYIKDHHDDPVQCGRHLVGSMMTDCLSLYIRGKKLFRAVSNDDGMQDHFISDCLWWKRKHPLFGPLLENLSLDVAEFLFSNYTLTMISKALEHSNIPLLLEWFDKRVRQENKFNERAFAYVSNDDEPVVHCTDFVFSEYPLSTLKLVFRGDKDSLDRYERTPNWMDLRNLWELRQHLPLDKWYNHLILWLLFGGDEEKRSWLLSLPTFDPSLLQNYPIRKCILCRDTENALNMLKDPRVDPCTGNDGIMIHAIHSNCIQVIKALLQKARVNPGANYNRMLMEAAAVANDQVFKSLYNDKRVDSVEAFILSARSGKIAALARIYKQNPSIVPRGDVDILLRILVVDRNKSHDRLVVAIHWLIDKFAIDPSMQNNEAIVQAARYGHLDVIDLLFHDNRVDPSAQNNAALSHLLSRIYPGFNFGETSIETNHVPIRRQLDIIVVNLLLSHRYVNQRLREMYPNRKAFGLAGTFFENSIG